MERQNFIDWMKAVGMFVIVVGHVVGSPYNLFNLASQPIYTKQLGVCFFIFIMGWSLANEHRTSFKVVYNRLFLIYFYGIIFALIVSAYSLFTISDINESNYAPFVLGVNVFFNSFPANPTTWYIGTYLHVLLFWFFFIKGRKVTKNHLIVALVFEILIRAVLLYFNKSYIAYMFLPNWITVFMLGGYLYQKRDSQWGLKTVAVIVAWVMAVALWVSPYNSMITSMSFPFRELNVQGSMLENFAPLILSFFISVVYISNTYVFFEIFRRLPCLKIVQFFARNSLITFIIHMPLIYALHPFVYQFFETEWAKKTTFILLIFVGTAIVSEIIQRLVNTGYIQNKVWDLILAVETKLRGTAK